MTITPSMMYWFTRLDNIHGFCNVLCLLFGLGVIIMIVATVGTAADGCYNEDNPHCKRNIKILKKIWMTVCGFLLFGILGSIFVPTSRQMAMIYVVPQLTESQIVKQDIPELYDLGINALKDWLKKDETNATNK